MADSMCGPSNGAKNLLAHTDRDRSMHQDRLINAPQANAGGSFRTRNPAQANGADAAFDNFQGSPVPFMEPHHMLPMASGPAPLHHHVPLGHPSIAAARLDSPATGGMRHAPDWVSEFNAMQLNGGPNMASSASAPALASGIQGMHPTTFGMGWRPFGPAAPQSFIQHPTSMTAPISAAAAASSSTTTAEPVALVAESAEVKSAFDDLFGQYDAVNEAEYARQTADFEAEEAKWMMEHGPSAEAITQEVTEIADEQDLSKKRMDHDLARAAGDILSAVSGYQNEKFQKSSFLQLMQRIADHEVVVDEKSFVDAETGGEVQIQILDESRPGYHSEENGEHVSGGDDAVPRA